MKKLFLLLTAVIAVSTIGCSSIDVAISKRVNVTKKMNKIAVFPFKIKGSDWGDEFSDSITHYFFKSGKIDVVEREAIKRIIKEQRLSMTGLVSEKSAVKIGKLLGADVIIIGRGSVLRHRHSEKKNMVPNLVDTFSLKAINVETGSLLITVRKEPGKAWDYRYRLKYLCGLTFIWDKEDVLIDSSRYDDISKQVVRNILDAINEIEAQKKLK